MERGVQRKLHAPCEWGEKPEAKGQGLTYPYVINVGIWTPEFCPNSPTAIRALPGSRNGDSGRDGITSPARGTLSFPTMTTTAAPTMWGSWNPATVAPSIPSREMPIMPASS